VDYEATQLDANFIANFQPFWAWAVGRVTDFTAAQAKFDRDQEYKSEQKEH
jgi:hypothetical protein